MSRRPNAMSALIGLAVLAVIAWAAMGLIGAV